MNNFDSKFTVDYNDNQKMTSFTLTIYARDYGISNGYYVVYPDYKRRELKFVPQYIFDGFMDHFNELSKKYWDNNANDKKHKNKSYLSQEEIEEFNELKFIISNSETVVIRENAAKIRLSYKFLEMLQLGADNYDFVTFVQVGDNEFLIINPIDAWMFGNTNESSKISIFRRAV